MEAQQTTIIPRKSPDFGLDGDYPKSWLDCAAFKTRFFHAMSLAFTEREKLWQGPSACRAGKTPANAECEKHLEKPRSSG